MPDEPQKKGRGRPKTLNKADVLDVAVAAYWAEGPARVSLNSICQRAGVSKPSVYREFGNEDGLTCAALESYAERVLAEVLEILASADPLAAKIARVAHLVAQDAQHEHGCLFVKMRTAPAELGAKTQALVAAMERMAVAAYAQALEQARQAGEWARDLPTELVARYVYEQMALALEMRARGQDPKDILALALSVLDLPPAQSSGAEPGQHDPV